MPRGVLVGGLNRGKWVKSICRPWLTESVNLHQQAGDGQALGRMIHKPGGIFSLSLFTGHYLFLIQGSK